MNILKRIIRIFLPKNNIYFVGSADKLPGPLDKELENEYILKSLENDEFAKNKLIEHNLRLVVYLAKRYEGTGYDLEDLVSIGTIGLIKGINTYKLDKNIRLATYASRCIDNEILMFLRKNKRRKSEISFEDNLSFDSEGNELHLEDILGTDSDIVTKGLDDELNYQILHQELEKLSDRDKKIIILRYGLNGYEEMTQKDVADYMNISQSYISRIEKKVIRKLKSVIK